MLVCVAVYCCFIYLCLLLTELYFMYYFIIVLYLYLIRFISEYVKE